MKEKSGFVYVYNPDQAAFYISKGVKVLATGIHPTTKRIWYKFGYLDSGDAHFEWCVRKH